MTDRADPLWAAIAGPITPAVRAAFAVRPQLPAEPLHTLLSVERPPVRFPSLAATDLSPRERHALAAAAGGPDLCLVGCPPGTDRIGFAVMTVLEAVRRREQVIVVTGTATDTDLVMARLLDAELTVGRAAGPDDSPDPDHGYAAHTSEADTLRRRMVEHLDHRRAAQAVVKSAALALPRMMELADELARLTAPPAVDPAASPAKSSGLLDIVRNWFSKPTPPHLDPSPPDLAHRQAEALDRYRAAARPLAAAGLPVPNPSKLADTEQTLRQSEADAAEAVSQAEVALAQFDADRPQLDQGLCRAVPVVVGPATALADPLLASADRVIVLSADLLDDATLDRIAAVAPARVLLGITDLPARPNRNGKSGSFLRPTLFRRLWDRFAAPEVWSLDGVQLLVTLQSHDPTATRDEPLADRPDVELRFTPTGDLVAVAFPPTATLAEAKALLATELGHVSLAPCGGLVWEEYPDRLVACWPAADHYGADWADLGGGVRELVCGTGPDGLTGGVFFDREAGWTRESAESWLNERLPSGRAVRLPIPAMIAG